MKDRRDLATSRVLPTQASDRSAGTAAERLAQRSTLIAMASTNEASPPEPSRREPAPRELSPHESAPQSRSPQDRSTQESAPQSPSRREPAPPETVATETILTGPIASDVVSTRQMRWMPVVLAVAAAAVALGWVIADPHAPTATQWLIVAILGAVGIVGAAADNWFSPPDDRAVPPWDVHTVWLLPAALLVPPVALTVLVAISVTLSMLRRPHPLAWRAVVGAITVLTTVAISAAARLIEPFLLAAAVGTIALLLIGGLCAAVVALGIGAPTDTALWLNKRWALIELGCALSGVLSATAMRTEVWAGLTALGPLLLAAFALRWPQLAWHARTDSKTGLPNAWHWEERTRELLAVAEARAVPATVMIMDIDHFKHVNDTYGHLVGDQVLAAIADALRTGVREDDLVGRFGGEEFVVTMFGLSPAAAGRVAERIRAGIAAYHHEFAAVGRVTDSASESCTVTCTIGLASSTIHGYDLTTLFDRADHALAEGKAAGRNRVRDAALRTAGGIDSIAPQPESERASGLRALWRPITARSTGHGLSGGQLSGGRLSGRRLPGGGLPGRRTGW